LEDGAPESLPVAIRAVASAVVADEIGNAPQRHGRFKSRGMADDPVRHEATVAAPGDAEPVLVDPWITCENRIDAIHDIDVGFSSPLQLHAAIEFLTISVRAARLCEEHSPAMGRIDLEFMEEIEAVHSGRTAMNAENHWICLAGLPAGRLHQESIDVPT